MKLGKRGLLIDEQDLLPKHIYVINEFDDIVFTMRGPRNYKHRVRDLQPRVPFRRDHDGKRQRKKS